MIISFRDPPLVLFRDFFLPKIGRRPEGLDAIHATDETVGSTDHSRGTVDQQVIQLVMAAVQTAAGDSLYPSG